MRDEDQIIKFHKSSEKKSLSGIHYYI